MSGPERSIRAPAENVAAEVDQVAADLDQTGSDNDQAGSDADVLRAERESQPADRIGLREPGFFQWAWRRIATKIPDLRPGQANLVIEGEAHTQRVIARLIVERNGLDVQAPGDDPVETVENLVRVLR
jgi:hypothetical protein